ncbi:hypothetical protein ISU07_00445 [Nocardioides islandensis]|uniref:Uncharacterized protein n=1 Tax=Nocardioides islandensis TaxID=433663 RepID=A0A930YIC8_9ACTN|nr:hypothetical protein [Nocardioides islandensis]MBF4761580.1 hypothetical protein [Nocardioides islandensis]
MTIEQQVRDRFDRATTTVPEADVAAAIAGGRRVRRRRRVTAYAVGSLAVAAVAASAVALPRLGDDEPRTVAPAHHGPADDGTFVPGTTVDTDLAAAVAAADPSLPAPRDVYPSDWSRDTPLPDADVANATEWQLVYDLAPKVELLVYVSVPIPGESSGLTSGQVVTDHHGIGDPTDEIWFQSMLQRADGRFVDVIEQVTATEVRDGQRLRVLTDAQTEAIAQAPGLDFPDPITPPPAP